MSLESIGHEIAAFLEGYKPRVEQGADEKEQGEGEDTALPTTMPTLPEAAQTVARVTFGTGE